MKLLLLELGTGDEKSSEDWELSVGCLLATDLKMKQLPELNWSPFLLSIIVKNVFQSSIEVNKF